MADYIHFYQHITRVAENRIRELIRHAEETEIREDSDPKVSSLLRDRAVCVYLSWRDVTAGWHTGVDLSRLEALAKQTVWMD